jgi:hypothetical protein
MRLSDVPRGSKIRVIGDDVVVPPAHRCVSGGDQVGVVTIQQSETLTFHHLDGMYSLCTDSEGKYVHIAAWTEVEVVE